MTFRTRGVATLFALGLLAAGHAHAEVSGSVTLTSDYLFRGLSQTNEEPALQGGIDYTHDSGFYAGAWGSSISWLADADPDVSSQVEVDLYLGYGSEFGDSGVGFDIGAILYWYPGDYPPGFTDPDTTELYFGLGYGIFAATYSYAVSDLFGLPDSDGSGNLDVSADWEFVPSWTLNAAVGKQWVSGYEGLDYAHWKLGVSKGFDNGFEIAAALNDNDLIGPDETFTFAVTKSF